MSKPEVTRLREETDRAHAAAGLDGALYSALAAERVAADAEREARDVEIVALRSELTCPSSDYEGQPHRCIRCDSEVGA